MDPVLLAAYMEVDALLPNTPPITPPEYQDRCWTNADGTKIRITFDNRGFVDGKEIALFLRNSW